MMVMQKNLPEIVKWHRKKAHLSQQKLADMAGVSRTAIQRLEEGIFKIQLDTLLKILHVLNISLEFSGKGKIKNIYIFNHTS